MDESLEHAGGGGAQPLSLSALEDEVDCLGEVREKEVGVGSKARLMFE